MTGVVPTGMRITWRHHDPNRIDEFLASFADVVAQKQKILGPANISLLLTVQADGGTPTTVQVTAPSLSDADLVQAKTDLAAFGVAVKLGAKGALVSSVVTGSVQ